jgi:carbamoyl-phosphate synthase large subunit
MAIDNQSTAPSFAAADIALKVHSIYAPEYLDQLKDIISTYRIDAVIPLNDLELPLLSRNKRELEDLGTRIIVSDPNFIDTCSDKWETYKYLRKLKIDTPLTFLKISDALMSVSKRELNFPLIVKPRWGSGSFGIEVVDNEIELQLAFDLLKIRLENSFLKNLNSKNVDEAIIIQEKLNGVEYGMDIVNDFKGNHVACFSRIKLAMRSGETDKAETIISTKFSKIGRKLAENSEHIGLMDIDFFVKEGKIYVLELNPRFGGGYPFSHQAGANVPAMYVDWLSGTNNVSKHNQFKSGMIFSKYDRLVQSNYKSIETIYANID